MAMLNNQRVIGSEPLQMESSSKKNGFLIDFWWGNSQVGEKKYWVGVYFLENVHGLMGSPIN